MASETSYKRHDTWPPLRGVASDENGLVNLTAATSLKFLAKGGPGGAVLISGTAVVIDPPDGDGFNWKYTWGTADLANSGDYSVELEVNWGSGKIETFPSGGYLTLHVLDDQG